MGIICTILFFGMLFGLFALLLVFWVKLNLLQMLPLLLISSNTFFYLLIFLATLTFVIGNTALKYI